VTGEDCAWYRVTLWREPGRHGDDGPGHDVLLETESPAWPALAGGHARVPVDPRLLTSARTPFEPAPDGRLVSIVTEHEYRRAAPGAPPPIVPAEAISGLRGHERLRLTEVRVPRGVPVFALGRVTGAGLRPSRAGLTLFTPDSRDEVIADRRESIRVGRAVAGMFALIGLALAGAAVIWLRTLG
jgi:hypothetical protein